jgi:hypothetical protein
MPQVDGGLPSRQLASALGQVNDAVDKYVERDAQDQAWRTQADINTAWVKWNATESEASRGVNAKGYSERVSQWWKDAAETYGKDLNPISKRMVSRNLLQAQVSALDGASRHENQELDRSRAEALDGSLQAEVSRGAAGGPTAAAGSVGIIQNNLREFAAATGKPTEWVAAQEMKYTTALHANVIAGLIQADPARAQEYFTANKGQIDGTRHDEIGKTINATSAINDGDKAAGQVWASTGPRNYNDPVPLDKMEAQLRETYPNDAPRRQAAIAALRERAAAHNAAQAESNAGNTNAVYALMDGGRPMAQVMRAPQWLALPAAEQHKIMLQREGEAAARESRAAAAESRAFTAEQRKDRQLLIGNGDAYLRYSDPEVLARMTRPQVEATRAVFGMEGAQHLLARYDTLQKPGAIAEARIDKQDFEHIAETMGLDPFNAKTPEKKKQLGELQFRVEQMINIAQQAKKQALTRDEKMTLMQGELARQVTVNPGWFSANRQTPVIQLSPADAGRVVVPAARRDALASEMQALYAVGKNPDYAPTPANLQRYYLRTQSRAADLIEKK